MQYPRPPHSVGELGNDYQTYKRVTKGMESNIQKKLEKFVRKYSKSLTRRVGRAITDEYTAYSLHHYLKTQLHL